ncbi:MAG: hypothetical protein PWQ28_809 [Candidatus Woesearchaeota archaeon]|nr:hypothetical protein [Candidatus Woesearchaeota archaeon]MDK2908152.1 hypothetical protein [Candidatus Woesearchaeota archaeon]
MLRRDVVMSIIDEKIGKILNAFYENQKKGYYLTQLSQETGVSLSSTYRRLKKLGEIGIIREEIIGPSKIYHLNDNEQVRLLGEIIKPSKNLGKIIKEFFGDIEALKKVVIYGEVKENKATLLFIGENIDNRIIEEREKRISEQYGIKLNHILLTEEQFEKMTLLGLYSGKKKVLFEKEAKR